MAQRLLSNLQQSQQKHPEFTQHYELLIKYFTNHSFDGSFPKEIIDELIAIKKCPTENESIIYALTPLMYMASLYAKCKCSKFPVGGCCYSKASGKAYIGFNMEADKQWIQYTVHGEQCTINNAFIHGETQIDILVISFTPCGFCRQFLNQLKNREELLIHIITINKTVTLPEILPFDFRPSDLPEIEFPNTNEFSVNITGDEIDKKYIDSVVESAKKSRLDNLLCYLGVGLLTKENELFVGNYIENCAHNPSFHPMNGAISQLLLNGKEVEDVTHVILVEYEKAEFQMKLSAFNILKGYGYTGNAKITEVFMK